jgi:hypothetical protein
LWPFSPSSIDQHSKNNELYLIAEKKDERGKGGAGFFQLVH